MKIGIWADAHVTKKVRDLTPKFREMAIQGFREMYDTFKKNGVAFAANLGDLLDKPSISPEDVQVIDTLESIFGDYDFPTYHLLGNHEGIQEGGMSILNILNLEGTVCEPASIDGCIFLPYDAPLKEYKNKIVFTHHDIYPENLSQLKGVDISPLASAKHVYNGHVHQYSDPSSNITNVGSLFSLGFGDNLIPCYHILDTDTMELKFYENPYSFLFRKFSSLYELTNYPFNRDRTIALLETTEDVNPLLLPDDFLRLNVRKVIGTTSINTTEEVIVKDNVNNIIKQYCTSKGFSEEDENLMLEIYHDSIQ